MEWLFPKKETKIYSVDEITTYIKNLLENNSILQDVQIRGEISNFRHHNGRHMYFDLKDEYSIVGCAMFWNSNNDLEFEPEDGTEVVVRGHVDIYKKKGSYQIIVEEMQLAGKKGVLYKKFIDLKEKLEREGLFKKRFKKPIPKIPKTIGVVSSMDGAAIRDIFKTVKRRFPHVKIIV